MRTAYLLILLVTLAVVVHDAEAGWKFWKKDKNKDDASAGGEEASSTVSTTTSTTTTTTTTTTPKPTTTTQKSDSSWKFWKKKKDEPSTTAKPASTTTTAKSVATQRPSANRGIAAAADPALAVGVGSVGDNIRNQPRRPNPGTEVGLDIGQPKPQHPGLGPGGTGYRDWAADLAGVGQPGRQSPKLPDKAPGLAPAGGQPGQGNRPASVPGTPAGQQPATSPGSRPASVPGSPSGYPTPGNGPMVGKPSTPVVTPSTPAPIPAHRPGASTPTPATRPSTPAAHPQRPTVAIPQPGPHVQPKPSSPGSPPASPTGTRSWAEVAGGGSKPGSPTPAPARSAQPSSPGARPGVAAGAAVAGGAAVAAGAAGAAAAAATTGTGKYSSNPTYSKGNTVTDEDLEKLSEALFIKDVNNANKYITLNLQKQTSSSSPKDEAPQPLLDVKPEALQIPTVQKVLAIYDNYKLDTREHEHISPAQRQEESLLIDTFLSTNVMSTAMRFLADKNFIKKDYYEYKDTLRAMWFNLYSRGEGRIGSTGFEHVFLTELKLGTEVSGLHNWIYFNAEEAKKRLDYLGYIKKVDLGNKAAIAKVHIKFNGIDKPVTNIFIGTSPELEMALYTVCFFARPEAKCPVSLGGTKFDIITHKFRYRGRDLIGSAYPDI